MTINLFLGNSNFKKSDLIKSLLLGSKSIPILLFLGNKSKKQPSPELGSTHI
ncbi:hypothetical protein RRG54_02765 [Mycoplasmopsis felis]|uniref:hypothetical protein n=1 Tax=Mycoplasmopsis felis TaxID=33923 RepID=UPI0021E03413|nr:hypothetical protein [Mycoplasmopsis felis]MCU9937501.1 hypothetical protein [Mycoplasmopsis felis]WQQ02426.1 hypothetical protein RNN91_03850 [Mycoplasmopsis felis]WQQ06473.1 hypothetical protein RRG40_01405 [Mycoplasmopsis felis]